MLRKIRLTPLVVIVVAGSFSFAGLLGCVQQQQQQQDLCAREPLICADLPQADIPTRQG